MTELQYASTEVRTEWSGSRSYNKERASLDERGRERERSKTGRADTYLFTDSYFSRMGVDVYSTNESMISIWNK